MRIRKDFKTAFITILSEAGLTAEVTGPTSVLTAAGMSAVRAVVGKDGQSKSVDWRGGEAAPKCAPCGASCRALCGAGQGRVHEGGRAAGRCLTKSSACGRFWQFAHPRPLSLLQRGLAPMKTLWSLIPLSQKATRYN